MISEIVKNYDYYLPHILGPYIEEVDELPTIEDMESELKDYENVLYKDGNRIKVLPSLIGDKPYSSNGVYTVRHGSIRQFYIAYMLYKLGYGKKPLYYDLEYKIMGMERCRLSELQGDPKQIIADVSGIVKVLQEHGIIHGDFHKSNIGQDESNNYIIFDLDRSRIESWWTHRDLQLDLFNGLDQRDIEYFKYSMFLWDRVFDMLIYFGPDINDDHCAPFYTDMKENCDIDFSFSPSMYYILYEYMRNPRYLYRNAAYFVTSENIGIDIDIYNHTIGELEDADIFICDYSYVGSYRVPFSSWFHFTAERRPSMDDIMVFILSTDGHRLIIGKPSYYNIEQIPLWHLSIEGALFCIDTTKPYVILGD